MDSREEQSLEEMVLYGGTRRDEEIPVKVRVLDDRIAGEIECIECDGTGIWTILPPDNRPIKCTTCKATGKVLISI